MLNNDVSKAIGFAVAAHSAINQKRKWSDEPYYYHPKRVAEILCRIIPDVPGLSTPGNLTSIVCAALLHDVVEDTGITLELIEEKFGEHVARLVGECTKTTTVKDGNREYRLQKQIEKYKSISLEAVCIKLADIIDNCSNIREVSSLQFAEIYIDEKRREVEALALHNPPEKLLKLARNLVND